MCRIARKTRRNLIALAAWLCLTPAVLGQEPDYPQDMYDTYQARTALFHDPALKPLNLGVRVQDGQAVLWGPIPTTQQSYRAERVLRQLPFLKSVVNELEVQEPEGGNQWAPADGPKFLPISAPNKNNVKPAETVSKPSTNPIIPTTGWVPVVAKPKLAPEPPPVQLHSPIPVATVSTAKPAPMNLRKSINDLLVENNEYRGLSVDEADGVVFIRGPQSQMTAIYDLAGRIARLPEVARIVVEAK